jgi:polyisoprenoid-binding protein YceI
MLGVAMSAGSAFAAGLDGKSGEVQGVIDDTIRPGQIKFVSEAPAEKIVGTADGIKGLVTFNLGELEKTTGKVSFPVKSMKTGNDQRDEHLRGKDWLNAEANPEITFELKGLKDVKVAPKADGKQVFAAKAVGAVTVNGVSKDVEADVKVSWLDAKDGGKVAGDMIKIEGAFAVKLADHKVAGKRGVVGNKVGELIKIELVLYGHTKK